VKVAVVGIGIHPFGRHPGVSASDMGVQAIRRALADADLSWKDIEYAFGGSLAPILPDHDNAPMADTLVNHLGLTGVPFVNVANGCATAGSAVALAANAIEAGACQIGLAVGFDKHPRGHFAAAAGMAGIEPWFGEHGFMVTTQFFAMKIQRYMHEFGLTPEVLAKVAAKNFRNGAKNPNAWRRTPFTEEEILESPMVNDPIVSRTGLCTCAQRVCAQDGSVPSRYTVLPFRSSVYRVQLWMQPLPPSKSRASAQPMLQSLNFRTARLALRLCTWPKPDCVLMANRST